MAKFRKPEVDKRRAEERIAAHQFAQRWKTVWTEKRSEPITSTTVEDTIGKPTRITGPVRCSGKKEAPAQCRRFYWVDLTKEPVEFQSLGLGAKQLMFYAEFLLTGALWHRGEDSVPIF